jgi:glutamate--cysteine ligase
VTDTDVAGRNDRDSGNAAADAATASGAERLRSRADAEAYVASVCFKHGPPRLVGVELEWLVHPTAAQAAPVDAALLRSALGPYAPVTLDPRSPARALPGGSTVTVEPGGQVELASPPLSPPGRLVRTVAADVAVLHRRLATHGLSAAPRASDPLRPPRRVLDHPRYGAMERRFDRIGPAGRSGMCSTAAVQVCVDAGEGADVALRWEALHALGPVLLAAFANSPLLHGRRTGWKSARMACWLTLDPRRTAPPPVSSGEPATAWAHRVVGTELLCVRRDGDSWDAPPGVTFADWVDGALDPPPTTADLDYHVSTLFPPVRPHGHLEVRYIDAQPGRHWALPVAVVAALLSDPDVTRQAREACAPAAGRWVSAARHGLADGVLQRSAVTVFELAVAALPGLEPPGWLVDDLVVMLARRVRQGVCPADLDPADPRAAGPLPPDPAPDPAPDPVEFIPHRPAVAPGDPEEART